MLVQRVGGPVQRAQRHPLGPAADQLRQPAAMAHPAERRQFAASVANKVAPVIWPPLSERMTGCSRSTPFSVLARAIIPGAISLDSRSATSQATIFRLHTSTSRFRREKPPPYLRAQVGDVPPPWLIGSRGKVRFRTAMRARAACLAMFQLRLLPQNAVRALFRGHGHPFLRQNRRDP